MEKIKTNTVKDYIFLEYGRKLYEAVQAKLIDMSEVNNNEYCAIKYYEGNVLRPFFRGKPNNWDEQQAEDLLKVMNNVNPKIIVDNLKSINILEKKNEK